MPEAAPATVAPTTTTHPNAPQNGAQPPAQGATTQTKPPDAGAKDWSAEYKRLESEHQKKVREQIVERRKWEATNKANAEKLAKLEQLEKREASARLNPGEFLKSIYGDNWHEVLTEFKVSGGTPAQLVQAEMQKLRDELDGREKSRAEQAEKAQKEAQAQAEEKARQTIFGESVAWYRAKQADYPVLAKLGPDVLVGRTIANRIETEFGKTGRILTTTEAADLIEGEILDLALEAGKHEKYKPKLQPVSTSTTVASASKQQQAKPQSPARRSITNDITGSTPSAKPPMSDKERRERAEAAYEAARRKG